MTWKVALNKCNQSIFNVSGRRTLISQGNYFSCNLVHTPNVTLYIWYLAPRHVARGGRRGQPPPPPPPPWRAKGALFGARSAPKRADETARSAVFREFRGPYGHQGPLWKTRGPHGRPKGPCAGQRSGMGPFQRSRRGPFEAPPPSPLGEILATCLLAPTNIMW